MCDNFKSLSIPTSPIADAHLSVAIEGVFTDSSKTPTTISLTKNDNVRAIGVKSGNGVKRSFYYATNNWIKYLTESWKMTTDKFNNRGVKVVSDYMTDIAAGFKFANQHDEELYQLFLDGKNEEMQELITEYSKCFVHAKAYNDQARAAQVFAGDVEEVKPAVKKAVISQLSKLPDIMKACAEKVVTGRMTDIDNKSAVSKIFNGKKQHATAWKRYFYTELWYFCDDFTKILAEAIKM